jgi:hypothetical protein
MKKKIHLFTILALITTFSINVAAQKTAMYAQTSTQLQLEKNSIQVDNFSFSDVLGPENQLQHTASFDFVISNDAANQNILKLLQIYIKEKASRQLSFVTVNYNGEALQERSYDNAVVEEINFSTLEAVSKSAFKATVRIRAGAVKLQKGGSSSVVLKNKTAIAISCNYSVTIGNLPTARITKISGLSIKPDAGQYTNFTIEVLAIDGAAWNQWFLTGAAGIKTEQGNIRLLAANLKDILLNISLMDIEIVSYSVASGNQQSAGRATIGLRMRGMAVK